MKSQLELCAKNLTPISEGEEEAEEDEGQAKRKSLSVNELSTLPAAAEPNTTSDLRACTGQLQFSSPPSTSDLIQFDQSGLSLNLKPSKSNNNTLDLGDYVGDVEIVVRGQSKITLFSISRSDLRSPQVTRSCITPSGTKSERLELGSASLQRLSQYDVSVLESRSTQVSPHRPGDTFNLKPKLIY
jgi:hypothetical protein